MKKNTLHRIVRTLGITLCLLVTTPVIPPPRMVSAAADTSLGAPITQNSIPSTKNETMTTMEESPVETLPTQDGQPTEDETSAETPSAQGEILPENTDVAPTAQTGITENTQALWEQLVEISAKIGEQNAEEAVQEEESVSEGAAPEVNPDTPEALSAETEKAPSVTEISEEAQDTTPTLPPIVELNTNLSYVVEAGQEYEIPLPIQASDSGQDYLSNLDSETGETLAYDQNGEFDQAIASILDSAELTLQDGALDNVPFSASVQGLVVENGINHGYIVLSLSIAADAPTGTYSLPFCLRWKGFEPAAQPQTAEGTMEVIVDTASFETETETNPSTPVAIEISGYTKFSAKPGQYFDLSLPIRAFANGETFLSNLSAKGDQTLSYAERNGMEQYSQAICEVLADVRLSLVQETADDLPFDTTNTQIYENIVANGENHGYATIRNVRVPEGTPEGVYPLPVCLEWTENVPDAQPQRLEVPLQVTIGSAPKEALEAQLKQSSAPPIVEIAEQPPLLVAPGRSLDITVPIRVFFMDQAYASNMDDVSAEIAPYMYGKDNRLPERYQQAVASLLAYATVSFPEDAPFAVNKAELSADAVRDGLNYGYAVAKSVFIPSDTPLGVYTIPLSIEWMTNSPGSEPQRLDTTIEVQVTLPQYKSLAGGGVLVHSYPELRQAIMDGAELIYLGFSDENQGTIVYTDNQGIAVNQDLTIDGINPEDPQQRRIQLTDYSKTAEAKDMLYAGKDGLTVTFQNLSYTGYNPYGMMNGNGMNNVTLHFENVDYTGRQMVHTTTDDSTVTFSNCNINLQGMSTGEAQELAETTGVTFYGNNNIERSSAAAYPLIRFTNAGPHNLHITKDATVDMKNRLGWLMQYPPTVSADADLTVEGQLSVSAFGSGCLNSFNDTEYWNTLTISRGASMVLDHQFLDAATIQAKTLQLDGSLSVTRQSSGRSVIRIEPGGLFTLNDGARLYVEDPGTGIINCKTDAFATMRWNTRAVTVYNNNTDTPTGSWNNVDMSPFSVEFRLRYIGADKLVVTNLQDGGKGAAILGEKLDSTLNMYYARKLAVGPSSLSLDKVRGSDQVVTGTADSGASVKVLEYEHASGQLGAILQQSSVSAQQGRFTTQTDPFAQPIGSPDRRVYAVSTYGPLVSTTYQDMLPEELEFEEVPLDLLLQTVPLSAKGRVIPRVDTDWQMEIYDPKNTGFQLYAKLGTPLTSSSSGDVLENGLVFVEDGNIQPITIQNDSLIAHIEPGQQNAMQTLQWPADEGILGWLPALRGVADEEYTGVIHWSLVAGP